MKKLPIILLAFLFANSIFAFDNLISHFISLFNQSKDEGPGMNGLQTGHPKKLIAFSERQKIIFNRGYWDKRNIIPGAASKQNKKSL